MSKKTVVLTGGAGFIGSHLCDRLLSEGFRVVCVDNFITGSMANIRHLLKEKDFSLLKHDASKYIEISGKVWAVLHFASLASPNDYLRLPIKTLKAGSLATHNALGLAKAKQSRFMFASTSEVYGDPLVHPQGEDYWGNVNPIGVRGCYDESKRFSEALTMAYLRTHKLDTRIVRIFNTYGERMRIDDGRVVPNFIFQALKGRPLTVYGSGGQTRSFCYFFDLVEGIYRLMQARYHQPINLGNPAEFTILEFAKIVSRLANTKSRISFKPLPQDDPRQRQPDISRARQVLKWQPQVKLEQGVMKTINWFKSNFVLDKP
jgi:dTDP-glucose 4,6-dehydratase